MITCKEDLIDTYVKNTPELRREFLSFAVKFGLIDSKSKIGESSEDAVVAYWSDATGEGPGVGCWFAYADQIKEECRELTLSDLKPTPTKFVKVEESIFDLKGEFERGELYSSNCEGHYTQLKYKKSLYLAAHQDLVYRKVEIDWRDEVKKLDSHAIFHDDGDLYFIIDSNSNDFISMCHEIASLTENPTN
ncbi:hypothetical protein VPHF89G1_0002 [Vibrio phage F89 g1]